MPAKLYILLFLAAGIAAAALLLIRSIRSTLYRFRNIAFSGAIIALISLTAAIILAEYDNIVQVLLAFPGSFAHVSVWLIGILGILMFASNVALMRFEGMHPTNMVGTFLGVIFVGGTVVIFLISEALSGAAGHADKALVLFLGRFVPMLFYCLLDYCECLMLGMIIMGWLAAIRRPRYDKDYIIILGCSISRTGGLLPLLKGRTNRAVRYAWEQEIASGKPLVYVPSGGQGADEIMSEGSAMELYLLSHGAEPYEVMPEKKSANTRENLAFSKKLIDAAKSDSKVAFSTTNYHVLRSGILAERLGLDAEGIASSTKWYFWPNGFAREVVALFVMSRKAHAVSASVIAVICALAALLT